MRVLGGLIALLLWPSIASADVIDVCTTCSYTCVFTQEHPDLHKHLK
jgi:hypothetical protein